MNKQDLIDAVATEHNITKTQSKEIVQTVFNKMFSSLTKGEGINFIGFGNFSVVKRAARKATHPTTGVLLKIPARKAVKFTPGTALKEAVKKNKKK